MISEARVARLLRGAAENFELSLHGRTVLTEAGSK